MAAKALASLGVEFRAAQERVLEVSSEGTESADSASTGEAEDQEPHGGRTAIVDADPGGWPAFSPTAARVLELSLREALQLGHSYIGTEHLLLGLIREGGGGVRVLQSFGIEPPRVRRQVMGLLGGLEVNAGNEADRFPLRVGEPKCTGCRADLTRTARYRSMTIRPAVPHSPPMAVQAVYCDQCGMVVEMLKAE